MLGPVIGIPQLGSDPELITRAESLLQGLLHAVAHLGLVPIVTGTIEMAISGRNRLLDEPRYYLVLDFPHAESETGKDITGTQSK